MCAFSPQDGDLISSKIQGTLLFVKWEKASPFPTRLKTTVEKTRPPHINCQLVLVGIKPLLLSLTKQTSKNVRSCMMCECEIPILHIVKTGTYMHTRCKNRGVKTGRCGGICALNVCFRPVRDAKYRH